MEYVVLLIALVGIVIGADVLVSGSVSLARRFCYKGKINRAGGLTLFIMFVAYCWYLLSNQTAI